MKAVSDTRKPSRQPSGTAKSNNKESGKKDRSLVPRTLWGHSIGLWIAIVGGTIAVIVLGVMVALRTR